MFSKLTTKVGGKTVSFLSSVACKAGMRPWTVAYKYTNGTVNGTATVSGTSKC